MPLNFTRLRILRIPESTSLFDVERNWGDDYAWGARVIIGGGKVEVARGFLTAVELQAIHNHLEGIANMINYLEISI